MLNFLKNIGPTEIIIIVGLIVLFFGSKIAVSIGRASGETFKEIKKVKNELTGAVESIDKPKAKRAAAK